MTKLKKGNGRFVIPDLEPHLPSVPTLHKDIARRVGRWAPESIKLALDALVERGIIKCITITDQHGFSRNLYWKDA